MRHIESMCLQSLFDWLSREKAVAQIPRHQIMKSTPGIAPEANWQAEYPSDYLCIISHDQL